ncbi:tetraacyldisaccharide 4'-kinase [Pontibacter beigongshangensis]|uniref:tetraacyldisaccharide 4'-kinase n=1 Tax=Pontibacter beigongshangensis TaxID=2574733 RepID=UPI001F514B72|nr:tetraacyldisaccharide 4'-kinase [Pontibacter beigongshangensis]
MMVKKLKLLLLPFSLLYGRIMALRNALYDKDVLHAHRFALPVIAVGNLTVGGTGKTPHVEYLLRLLAPYQVATLSRGYKRSTKGFVLASEQASATTVGDEPFQYYKDFGSVTVAVCEDRVQGIKQLQHLKPELEVIVLDDAMQHRAVQPSLNLLITDYRRPFYKDFVLPAGLLREPRGGARRADAVLVSKCPENLQPDEKENIMRSIRRYSSPGAPIYFTSYRYGEAVGMGMGTRPGKEVILLTGIANAGPLVEHLLKKGFIILQHLAFPDHHHYTLQDLQRLQELLRKEKHTGASIITTRKDAVKLTAPTLATVTASLPLFYIPVQVDFLNNRQQFDQLILQHVKALEHGQINK